MNKREFVVGVACLVLGVLITALYLNSKLSSNRKLTARILSNAIGSMEASQNLAESCSDAYNAASRCVSNLSTCNLQKESMKLDEFNTRRKHADQQIDLMNKGMEKIINSPYAVR